MTTPSAGVWINAKEIAALPASGAAWTSMRAAAAKSWGTPTIADQNSSDDTDTLAGALVSARSGDEAMKTKVRNHLMALASNHPYERVLGLARQLPSYIIAADVVGLNASQRASFESFLREAVHHKMAGHSGGDDLASTAYLSPNNWGTMSRAAMAAVDVYLGDKAGLAKIADTQEAWLGGTAPNTLKYSSTNWHAGKAAGINVRGSQRDGHTLDGVLPEDQRRTGEYTWPAPKGSYPHEALQGAVVASVILDRAGALPFEAGDHALQRAEQWLATTNGNPAASDDGNTPWLLAKYGAGSFAKAATPSPAKNIAWAAWTAA
ncbi:hypothetical protein [Aquihabitans sp. McL0605]|uniref:hypothetical protein n=1 Tax=Aquihabitans sp. McL0605 TaxID=3415671 RepID=UPI003CECBBE1